MDGYLFRHFGSKDDAAGLTNRKKTMEAAHGSDDAESAGSCSTWNPLSIEKEILFEEDRYDKLQTNLDQASAITGSEEAISNA